MELFGICLLWAVVLYCWWKSEDAKAQRAHELELAKRAKPDDDATVIDATKFGTQQEK